MKCSLLIRHWLLLAVLATVAGGCGDESADSSITLSSGSVVELYPVVNQSKDFTFESAGNWTASCPADWVSISPRSGSAGRATIRLTTTATNKTKSARSTSMTIASGGTQRKVTVVQSGKYAIFDQRRYDMDATGGRLQLSFKSNTEQSDNLQIRYTEQSWISWPSDSRTTRAEWTGKTGELIVAPNTSNSSRTAVFVLSMATADGQWMGLDTTYVAQAGVNSGYTSSDYSADGRVTTLQQSTTGRGISFVLMGDGFADKDVADGTYDRVMARAMEHLFSEEPVKSLRSYFNVYAVTAVSKNDAVGAGCTTVFSTVPSDINTEISFDDKQVNQYAKKVAGFEPEQTVAVVIVNSSRHNGVTSLLIDTRTGKPRQYAIALCTLMGDAHDEEFRQVLVHEAIGHGLAKLADEYGYDDKGTATDDVVSLIGQYHHYNWMLNVDTTDDGARVAWSPFIGDSRFAAESIGVYEGGYTYARGVYRPTAESMMRSNQSPFNAPSRKAIYDRVMLLGEGKDASTNDEFADFDEQHKPQRWNYALTRAPWHHRFLAPPVIKRTTE